MKNRVVLLGATVNADGGNDVAEFYDSENATDPGSSTPMLTITYLP